MVSVDLDVVATISPITDTVVEALTLPLQEPIGIAVSTSHMAIADRTVGLVIVAR